MRLVLNNVTSARKTLARAIRAFNEGTLEEARYKGIVHGMNNLLSYFKHEDDLRIEARIEMLEKHLERNP